MANNRKGKTIMLYELHVTVAWEGQMLVHPMFDPMFHRMFDQCFIERSIACSIECSEPDICTPHTRTHSNPPARPPAAASLVLGRALSAAGRYCYRHIVASPQLSACCDCIALVGASMGVRAAAAGRDGRRQRPCR